VSAAGELAPGLFTFVVRDGIGNFHGARRFEEPRDWERASQIYNRTCSSSYNLINLIDW
jgi:hypothetical protein